MKYKIGQKIRLIKSTWENSQTNIKLKIGNIYTIQKCHDNIDLCTLVEGYHNGGGGWWYNLDHFEPVSLNINKNIKIL